MTEEESSMMGGYRSSDGSSWMAHRVGLLKPLARSAGWGLTLATLVTSLSIPGVAHADGPSASDDQTARAAFFAGLELRDKGATAEALEKLRTAYKLAKTPIIAYELGVTLHDSGKLVEAVTVLLEASRLPAESDAATEARVKARALAGEIEPQLASVTVKVAGLRADANEGSATVDGEKASVVGLRAGLKVDPGHHEIRMELEGFEPWVGSVDLKKGESKSLDVSLVAKPVPARVAPAPSKSTSGTDPEDAGTSHGLRTAGFVSLGVAGAGLAVGVVGGLVAMNAANNAKDACSSLACPTEAFSKVETGRTMATVSTIGFVLAGAAAAFGITAILLDGSPAATRPERAALRLKVNASGLGGTF